MNIARHLAVLLIAAATATGAFAQRTPVPPMDRTAIPVTAPRPVTAERVEQAIRNGGNAQPYKWTFSPAGPNALTGQLFVRGKHTIMVNVTYSATQYSITYRDSINMNYKVGPTGPVIHPFYNRWVEELITAVSADLAKG